MRKGKDPDPDPYLCVTDPNPWGPKTCGFRSGSPRQNKAAEKNEKNEAAQIRSRILPDKVTTVRYLTIFRDRTSNLAIETYKKHTGYDFVKTTAVMNPWETMEKGKSFPHIPGSASLPEQCCFQQPKVKQRSTYPVGLKNWTRHALWNEHLGLIYWTGLLLLSWVTGYSLEIFLSLLPNFSAILFRKTLLYPKTDLILCLPRISTYEYANIMVP
jgi:hypothetical protein